MEVTLDSPPDRMQVGRPAFHTEHRPLAVAPNRWSLDWVSGYKISVDFGVKPLIAIKNEV